MIIYFICKLWACLCLYSYRIMLIIFIVIHHIFDKNANMLSRFIKNIVKWNYSFKYDKWEINLVGLLPLNFNEKKLKEILYLL